MLNQSELKQEKCERCDGDGLEMSRIEVNPIIEGKCKRCHGVGHIMIREVNVSNPI